MTITYEYGSNLYVNTTNRCSCACEFCLRDLGDGVGGAESLWLEREPSKEEIFEDIMSRDLTLYKELVFCGYGEPTFRLADIIWVCNEIKARRHIRIRMDTNGHGDLIYGPGSAELMECRIDVVSISLNTSTAQKYAALCHPRQGEEAYYAMLDFARRAVRVVPEVVMTVVDVLPEDEIKACREICEGLGAKFRVRKFSGDWK